jgi:hypothetical protein
MPQFNPQEPTVDVRVPVPVNVPTKPVKQAKAAVPPAPKQVKQVTPDKPHSYILPYFTGGK